MDDFIAAANAASCAILAAALGTLVIWPAFRDGLIVKLGLIVMCLGFTTIAWALADGPSPGDLRTLGGAMLMVHLGLAIVVAGWWWRVKRARMPQRRATDWMDLDLDRRAPR